MRIERKHQVRVLIAVQICEEKSSLVRAQYIFEQPEIDVLKKLESLKIAELSGLVGKHRVRLRLPARALAQLLRRLIGKPQHCLVEVLVELLGMTQDAKIVPFFRARRRDVQVSRPAKNR